jgi:hypothetical protein
MAEALFQPSKVFDESAKKGIQEIEVDFNALLQTDWTYAELHDFLDDQRMLRLNDTCLLVTKAANEPFNDFSSMAYRYTFYCQLLPSRRWKSFTLLVDGESDYKDMDHSQRALAAGGLLAMFGKSRDVINLYFQAVETKKGSLAIGIVALPKGVSSKESKVRKLTVIDTDVCCEGMATGKNLGSYLQGIQELDLRAQMREQDWKDLFSALHSASDLKILRLDVHKFICKQGLLELVMANSAIEEIKHDVGNKEGKSDESNDGDIMAKINAQVAANKSANVKNRGRDEDVENETKLAKLPSNMPSNAPKTVSDQELPKNCTIS